MRPLRFSLRFAFAAPLLLLATACHADEAAPVAAERRELGLMGTIPIYWGEAGDFGAVLSGGSEAHWARAQLERDYDLRPLDALDADSLANLDLVLLAQPRALSPAENVALDEWVRAGGQLLLFADPLLTGDSRFPVGDRRRPQGVILLSPILTHWGLGLEFDDSQALGYTLVPSDGGSIPVNLPGSLVLHPGDSECAILAAAVLADCKIGKGRAVVLADAALLDLHEPHPAAAEALKWLTGLAFAQHGENAGATRGGSTGSQ